MFPSAFPKKPFLYPVLDSNFSNDLVQDAMDAIRAGVEIFQIRAKNLPKNRVLRIIEQLESIAQEGHACMIVNDYVDMALVSNASGVHLGQEDFPVLDCRAILPNRIIGISTHNREQFSAALNLPVDYIAVGPVYHTTTKPGTYSPLGPSFIKEVRSWTDKPLVCIGGIRESNIRDLLTAGADGIALISELYRGSHIYSTICRLQDLIRNEKI
jgi:thiamine-phosphate pyrophosphorylase